MTLSFSEFALQLLKLKLPAKALDAAAASGFVKLPISMLAVISSAAPYLPGESNVDDSHNTVGPSGGPPLLVFSWTDPANSPSSGGTPPNQLRQATSWNLTVREAGGEPGAPVIDASVPFKDETSGLVQYDYVGIQLNGQYIYQITAFNDYGSASTAENKVWITVPGVIPAITVSMYLDSSTFRVKGSGFTPGSEVSVQVLAGGWGGGGGGIADQHGNIQTDVSVLLPCRKAGGGKVQFWATDEATNAKSNTVNSRCP